MTCFLLFFSRTTSRRLRGRTTFLHFDSIREMHRCCLLVFVACLFFGVCSSARCYTGTDRQCKLQSMSQACQPGQVCQCVKYRFSCAGNETACNEQEPSTGTVRWSYGIVSKDRCNEMQTLSNMFMEVTCCSKDRCNRPAQGKCSWSQERRRANRRLADLLSSD